MPFEIKLNNEIETKAYKKLISIYHLTRNAQELQDHIAYLRNRLMFPNSSLTTSMPDNNGATRDRTEYQAELMDLIDEYNKLFIKIERERLQLISMIDDLRKEDEQIALYLTQRFVWGKSSSNIAFNSVYSVRQVNRIVKKGIKLFAKKYGDKLDKIGV